MDVLVDLWPQAVDQRIALAEREPVGIAAGGVVEGGATGKQRNGEERDASQGTHGA